MANEIRLLHSFQYKQYHSLTLEANIPVEDSIAQMPDVQEAFQAAAGEAMLKTFARYAENSKKEDLQAYLNAIMPNEIAYALRSNPVIMDALLLAAKKRLSHE